MPSKDAEERKLIARLAALEQHAKHIEDASKHTAPARRAQLAAFERKVDPEGRLDRAERERRAKIARKAHLARIRLLGLQTQRRNAAARRAAKEAEAADSQPGAA
jgi:hypothetical protein